MEKKGVRIDSNTAGNYGTVPREDTSKKLAYKGLAEEAVDRRSQPLVT